MKQEQPLSLFTEKEFLSVSELNNLIRDVINMGMPNAVWLCGEIQGYNRNKDKKHIFFELCEKDPLSKDIVARIGLVIFSGKREYLEQILAGAENAFALKDDIEVKFLCRVDFYPPHGAVRLIVESIDPIYTLGKIAQEKQKLIALLKKKGTLDKNKTLELPLVPLRIGLITAYDSAAYNDFIHELKMSGFGFKVFLRNTLMQGKGSESDVCRAINELNAIPDLDVIVITRGGGSLAELSCFDSEPIAKKIADSSLPVLSGIGHEINITITDLAAHTYQKTPTAAAHFLAQRVENFLMDMEEKAQALIELATTKLDTEKRDLKNMTFGLQSRTTHFFRAHHQTMVRCQEMIKRHPLRQLRDTKVFLKDKRELLLKTVATRVKHEQSKLQQYERIVDMASPKSTFQRGFSVTRTADGKLVRTAGRVKPKDVIRTELVDGILESRIDTIKEEQGGGTKIQ